MHEIVRIRILIGEFPTLQMYPVSLTTMFQSVGLFYGFSLPVIVLVLFLLITLPVVFRPSMRAEAICYAAFCCMAEMLGILLMTAGGLPALYAVFSGQPLSEVTYLGLLIVFGIGGLLYLWHDSKLRAVDPASKAIPVAIFFITWKFIGLLVTVFAGLSFVLRLMLVEEQGVDWWVTHLIMLLYGLIISWFTLHRTPMFPVPAFTSTQTRMTPAAAVKKPVANKPVQLKAKRK